MYVYFGLIEQLFGGILAAGLTTAAPTFGTPTIGQVHALPAAGLTTAAPAFGTPAIGQIHALPAAGLITAAPAFGAVTVYQVHGLLSTGLVTAAPAFDAVTFHAISGLPAAVNLAAAAPIFGIPVIGQADILPAGNLVVGSPAFDPASIGQTHVLSAGGLGAAAPTFGAVAIGQVQILPAAISFVAASPVFTSPVAAATSNPVGVSLTPAPPIIGSGALNQFQSGWVVSGKGTTSQLLNVETILVDDVSNAVYQIFIDISGLDASAFVTLCAYTKVLAGGALRLCWESSFNANGVAIPIKISEPIVSEQEFQLTIKQTQGRFYADSIIGTVPDGSLVTASPSGATGKVLVPGGGPVGVFPVSFALRNTNNIAFAVGDVCTLSAGNNFGISTININPAALPWKVLKK